MLPRPLPAYAGEVTTSTLARRERHALCDDALALGAGSPTLCGSWTAIELVAHLWVREHRPLGALGVAVPGLGRLTDAAMARAVRTPFEELVAKVREPGLTPFALQPVDVLANTLEYLVHHEDLRRGVPAWEERTLPAEDLDEIWTAAARMGRLLVRRAGVPVTVRRSDTGAEKVLRGGDRPVVVSGPVVEVVLFLFGRDEVRDLSFDGPDDAVARLRGSDRSF